MPIPIGGAGKLSTFVTLLGANKLNVAVVVDSSTKCQGAVKRLRENDQLTRRALVEISEFAVPCRLDKGQRGPKTSPGERRRSCVSRFRSRSGGSGKESEEWRRLGYGKLLTALKRRLLITGASLYRFDDETVVNPPAYGDPTFGHPVLRPY